MHPVPHPKPAHLEAGNTMAPIPGPYKSGREQCQLRRIHRFCQHRTEFSLRCSVGDCFFCIDGFECRYEPFLRNFPKNCFLRPTSCNKGINQHIIIYIFFRMGSLSVCLLQNQVYDGCVTESNPHSHTWKSPVLWPLPESVCKDHI